MDKISAIYANAIYDLAISQNREDAWRDQLETLGNVWRNTPELVRFFMRTQISKSEKKAVLKDSFGASFDVMLVNMMCLLVDKDRMKSFLEIILEYRHLYNAKHQIAEGTVYSVRPLDESEIERLNQEFSAKKGQRVYFSNRIDPTLISGIKIQLDGKVMDGSMKSRINNLRTELVKGSR